MAMVDATAVPPEGRNGGRFGEHPREHHWPCAGRCSLCPPLRAAHDRHGPPHAVCRVAHMVPGPAHMPPVRAHVSVSMRARAAQYTRTWRGSARPSSRRDRRTIARRFIAGAAPAAVAAEVPKGRLRGAVSRPFGTLGLVGLRRGRSPALKRWAIVSRPLGTLGLVGLRRGRSPALKRWAIVSRPLGTLGLVGLRRGRSPALKRWAIVSRPLGTLGLVGLRRGRSPALKRWAIVSRPLGTLGLVGLRRGRSPALKRWAIVSRPLGTATPVLQDSEEIPWGGIAAWEFSAGEEGGARRRTSGGTRLDLSPQEGVTDMPDRFAVHKERGMVTLAVVDRVPRPPARR